MPFIHPLQEILRQIGPAEGSRVGPAPRPVDPRQATVGEEFAGSYGQHRRKVVLVHVACRPAEFGELGVELGVFHNVDGELPVDFEPLGPLPPVGDVDFWQHAVVVATPAVGAGVVEGAHEAVFGGGRVVVDCGEVVERNARFG